MTTTALLPVLLHLVALALGAATLVAMPYVVALIKRRTKPGAARDTLLLVAELMGIGVRDMTGAVADLKNPDKPGEWNAAAEAAIKAKIIADVRAAEPAAVRSIEAAAANPADAAALLSRMVQSEYLKFKATEGTAAVATLLTTLRPPALASRVVTPGDALGAGRAGYATGPDDARAVLDTPTDPARPSAVGFPRPPAVPADLRSR